MNKLKFVVAITLASVGTAFILPEKAYAQGYLPPEILNIFNLLGVGGSGTAAFITSRIQTGLFIALGIIILVAVVYALIAAFKYIQSQGDPGKIEEAQKAIKAIFLGIAAMMIAIVGIVLVFVFFGARPTDPSLYQTCLSAPASLGCTDCRTNGSLIVPTPGNPVTYGPTSPGDPGYTCAQCETAYNAAAASGNPADLDNVPAACQNPISN